MMPEMCEHRSSTIYVVVVRPDRHCGDDLVRAICKNLLLPKPVCWNLAISADYCVSLSSFADLHSWSSSWVEHESRDGWSDISAARRAHRHPLDFPPESHRSSETCARSEYRRHWNNSSSAGNDEQNNSQPWMIIILLIIIMENFKRNWHHF